VIEDNVDARRVLREVRLLHSLKHENIVKLTDILYDNSGDVDEMGIIYLV
jgi:mitogen-activated protein kinase 1/3